MLNSMTNETLIFLPRIIGLKGLIVEQGIRHYSFDAVINLLILRTFCGE